MSDSPLTFEFDEVRSAFLALDTLHELGYRPDMAEGTAKPTLHIHVDRQDITSALEIAQAYGGRLTDTNEAGAAETDTYTQAYDLDEGIRIPAHLVAEDLPFEDASVPVGHSQAHSGGGTLIESANAFQDGFDLSEETFDGFSAGIRL